MAEEAVVWLGEALSSVGEFYEAYGGYIAIAVAATSAYMQSEAQRQAQNRARDAYNASLRDRYVMQRTATQQRAMVLGRARVSGPMVFTKSFGTSSANLAFIVALAAHECDAIEDVYFDDDCLVLDGSGNVINVLKTERFSINAASASFTLAVAAAAGTVSAVATYDTGDVTCTVSLSTDGLTATVSGASSTKIGALVITYQPAANTFAASVGNNASHTEPVVADISGNGSWTAPAGLIVSSVRATRDGGPGRDTSLTTSVSGTVISFSGAGSGDTVYISYQWAAGSTSRARVRKYLGAPGQTADARLISLLPSYWTSAHRGDGICYVIVELDYDPDSFPGGLPNVSAVVRGLKCFDPRTSTTAWTDNPALLMRGFWLHPLGANRSSSEIDDTAIIAAANVCDTSATYTVGDKKSTRPLYRAGTVAAKDVRPQDVLNDLSQAMGGRWVVLNNTLRVKAGSYSSPVAAMDETWLHDGSAVQVQPRRNRSDLVNTTVGTFADEAHDWQNVSYPKVKPAAYVTADGRELATDIHYPAVTFSGQCQFLSQAYIRYGRAGLTIKVSCNLRAYPLEVFDVVTLSLARFGWVSKTFEVIETGFSIEGLIELTLKEIDASIWTLDASFNATDYALKTNLPSPWTAEVPVLATPASGTNYLLKQADGTIVTRIYVSWAAITTPNVVNGGTIEIQWQRVGDTTGTWQSMTVPGDATSAFITGVQDGKSYLIRARTRTRLAASSWSVQQLHIVLGKSQPPSNVSGLNAVVIPGALHITWTLPTDLDYDHTVLRYGATWAGGTPLPFNRPGDSYDWPWPPTGNQTIWAAHVDTTGNVSAAPVSFGPVSVTMAALAPANSALSIKLNVNDFAGTVNFNEAYVHGRDASGAAVDAPGSILVNGVSTAVPNGPLNTNFGPVAGYIVWDSSGATFSTGPGPRPYVLARRYQGQWQYDDNNAGTWTTFTPTATHFVIGTLESGGPDTGNPGSAPGLIAASIWAAASTLNSLEATADAAYALAAGSATVSLVNDAGMEITANTVQKVSGGGGWNAAVHSRDSFTGGAYVSWVNPDPATYSFGLGLNTDPTTDASYSSVDFWLYNAGTTLNVFNNGTYITGFSGAVAAGDVLAVVYDGSTVSYLRNGTVLFSQSASISAPLFLDSSFDTMGGKATNIQFGPMTSIAPALAAAATAQGTANTAATNASSALSTLATMRSNGYIDAAEKPALIKAYQAITDEFTGIYNAGTTYGLTTLRNAYNTATNNLSSYLSGLSPSWSDTTTDTPITPATDQATWAAYYSARQTLLNAIADETAKRAQWALVSGTTGAVDTVHLTPNAATTVYEVTDSTRRYFDSINWTSQPPYAGNELAINSIGPYDPGTKLLLTVTAYVEITSHAVSFFDAATFHFQYQQPPNGPNATLTQQVSVPAGQTDKRTVTISQSITWPSGGAASLAMNILLALGVAAATAECYISNATMRVEVIKR